MQQNPVPGMRTSWGAGSRSDGVFAVWRRLVLRQLYWASMVAWKKFQHVLEDPAGRSLRRLEKQRKAQEKVLLELTRKEEEMRMARASASSSGEETMPAAVIVGKGEYLKPVLQRTETCSHEEVFHGTNAHGSYTLCLNQACKKKVHMPKVPVSQYQEYVRESSRKNPAAKAFYASNLSRKAKAEMSAGTTRAAARAAAASAPWTALSASGREFTVPPVSETGSAGRQARAGAESEDDASMGTPATEVEWAQREAYEGQARPLEEVAPMCQRCQVQMTIRRNRFGNQELFWGCPNFPEARGRCRYTLPYEIRAGQEPPERAPAPSQAPMARQPPGSEPRLGTYDLWTEAPRVVPSTAPAASSNSSSRRPEQYHMSEAAASSESEDS